MIRTTWVLALVTSLSCGAVEETSSTAPGSLFRDVTSSSGIDFVHQHGGSGRRYMVETMGSGGGLLDYNNDGLLDVYLVQGAALPGFEGSETLTNRLYRNEGDLAFTDVSAGSGADDSGWGMGSCFGDVDNDGWVDIHVTNFGPDSLLRNRGDGTFEDATEAAGIDNPDWGASCGFADYDRDGCLDLYVVNYVHFTLDNHIRCGPAGAAMYCHPDVYDGVPDRLYRGRCDATFEEVTAAAGVRVADVDQSKGLGLVWSDFDGDGFTDLYVTNDSTRNFLYRNQGDGTFADIGVTSGTAFNDMGATEAGMGVTSGDGDGDGALDLFVTNLDFETNTMYRNEGGGLFFDSTTLAGLAAASTKLVGFGTNLFDADLDGDLDLLVVNGHILDNVELEYPSLTFAQRNQLFLNDGSGRFTEAPVATGGPFDQLQVSRGSAVGDLDNDGDVDILVTNNRSAPALLVNDNSSGNWLGLRLLSKHGGRAALGARARLSVDGRVFVAEVLGASSYLSQGDPRLLFGLGDRTTIEALEIRWPDGEVQHLPATDLSLNRYHDVRQAGGP